ncbi:hypothetical protein PtrSN002B_006786 [Pyrenophora tritici-repentis]|uniref:Uncharacterized protein n=1 Tax=Pyrenophora tritici-repentis TaxID=45151 RepID=A0A2W1G8J4_9PLEO|nr:hypothetical protein PtrV1_07863 [Pyrenophora tritici-repentis]KAF7448906.1 hypothetical protein A1F99_059550 [Pyrenophora tritici-repentis]KAF7571098.1 hypothetical protein PtrM4_111000 [Pyrenophora tritici-repentis]KAG9384152.1 hypothetical protein A1F94_006063 [Pyrenophora tritici-repentis]KAI0576101.1 hypothetical protein Alg215_07650 [Pyrenophora tritici-repentis]
MPAITPAPRPAEVHVRSLQHRQDPDALDILQVLITALPLSLRQIAATNIPAVSSILWSEFLDDKRPQWFQELPYDIQSYFIREFGPATAAPPASGTLPTGVTASVTGPPTETSALQSSSLSGSEQVTTSTPTALSSSSIETSSLASSDSSTLLSISASSATSLSASISSTLSSSAIPTTTADPIAPEFSDSGLTRREKVAIGVGVPLALLVVAVLLFSCCFLLRRKRRRAIEGSQPPSSPGFIPHFSFQDRGLSRERLEHRAPLNPSYHQSRFVEDTNWEDEGYDPVTAYQGHTIPPAAAPTPSQAYAIAEEGRHDSYQGNSVPAVAPQMGMQDNHRPILAPALYHSHSSNRARGRRTSYTSLHSVAEVTEPESETAIESPVLGRHNLPPLNTRIGSSSRKPIGATPTSARSIKRKPVPISPAADMASRSLLRPPLARNADDHSGSSSSGLVLSSLSSYKSSSSNEDYGPEYSHDGYNNYSDGDDGAYGGHVSLDRYGDPGSPREMGSSSKSGKTEWPLRNMMGGGSGREKARVRSPVWDRVYERV